MFLFSLAVVTVTSTQLNKKYMHYTMSPSAYIMFFRPSYKTKN